MPSLPPSLVAGTLLVAIPLLKDLGLPHPTATAALEATGAARTTAYKAKAALEEALPGLLRPPGRPPSEPEDDSSSEVMTAVHAAVLAYVFEHPGCVSGSELRRTYSDGFRRCVLDLCAAHAKVRLQTLAQACGVPLPTLKSWLRGEVPQVEPPKNLAAIPDSSPSVSQIETVLQAWEKWKGKFLPFCEHVQYHLRIPFGRKTISDILEAVGARIPKRRGRPDPDASALRGAFDTFHPGAQWLGDGAELVVEINGQRFACNLELNVDAFSGALVGACISPVEDAAAVADAFADGVACTGAPPLALLLDNKPCNHCEAVDLALGDGTIRIRARPFKPTDKPHVEGSFGLFAQQAPPLAVQASTLDELAGQIAVLVFTAWARAVNGRPRKDRDGKSRIDLYKSFKPTPEEIARAKEEMRKRLRKQERARRTRERRLDPAAAQLLDDAFQRLGLEDPERHFRLAIASWPLDAIVEGIAIFEGRRKAGTLPERADAAYLRGIVRNVALENEGWQIAEALLRERLSARDRFLQHLGCKLEEIEEEDLDPEELIKQLADKALEAKRRIDRIFWLRAAADAIQDQEPENHKHLLRIAARRIHSTHSIPSDQRQAAARFLFAKVIPLT